MSGPSVSDQADAIACSGGDLVDLGLQNVNLNDNVTIETTNGLLCKSASSGVGVSPQYGFFTEHATENSLAKHTYTRPDLLKVVHGPGPQIGRGSRDLRLPPDQWLLAACPLGPRPRRKSHPRSQSSPRLLFPFLPPDA